MNVGHFPSRRSIVVLRTAVREHGLAAVARRALWKLQTGRFGATVARLAIGKGGTHLSSGSSSLEKRPASSRLESHERVGRNPKGDDAELIYYLHIPKTAGTSVIHFLHDVYDPALICPYGLWDELVHASSEELAAWRVYVGHFGGVLPLWLRRWPRTLTVLRDPVARTISHIRHVKRDFRHPLHRLALGKRVAEYCLDPTLSRSVENLQARYLASLAWGQALTHSGQDGGQKRGQLSINFEAGLYALDRGTLLQQHALDALESLDAVGIAEEHASTLKFFAEVLNVPAPHSEYRINVAPGSESSDLDLKPEDLAAIDQITEIDRVVYEYALRRFRHLAARKGPSTSPMSSFSGQAGRIAQ